MTDRAGKLLPASLLTELKAAEAAAQAARAVPGVVRLQPGVWGLLRQLATHAWTQATGKPAPDVAGVDVTHTDQGARLRVELRIVVSVDHQAAEVGSSVHEAVATAVASATAKPADVRVHIVEIALEPDRRQATG